jgi:hypothetical protein
VRQWIDIATAAQNIQLCTHGEPHHGASIYMQAARRAIIKGPSASAIRSWLCTEAAGP